MFLIIIILPLSKKFVMENSQYSVCYLGYKLVENLTAMCTAICGRTFDMVGPANFSSDMILYALVYRVHLFYM